MTGRADDFSQANFFTEGGTPVKPIPKRQLATAAARLSLAMIGWSLWENSFPVLTTYTIYRVDLPDAFDGCRIVQISDFHNTTMGKDNQRLLSLVRQASPDIIAITGDFVDSRHTDIQTAMDFAGALAAIAPCYYVTGNHEARFSQQAYLDFEQGLLDAGVTVLHGERVVLTRGEEQIFLLGLDDPDFRWNDNGSGSRIDPKRLRELAPQEAFTVLLSHQPRFFQTYVEGDMDLVLCGHVHGGQFRLPFAGGILSPDQGLFPTYDAGVYTRNNTSMVVSRGIGNSVIPVRINNRPEVVCIQLTRRGLS